MQYTQDVNVVLERFVEDKIAFDGEAAQVNQKMILFSANEWIITQETKPTYYILNESTCRFGIALRDI